MTDRFETKSRACRALTFTAVFVAVALSACTGGAPRLAKGENGTVFETAPRMSQFQFADAPLAAPTAFGPWAALAAQSEPDATPLEACLNDKEQCASPGLLRFRKLMELAEALPKHEQLNLVHHYFNTITWTNDARDTWSTLYHTAVTNSGDCEDIALAKYQTLRKLGWAAEDMRVLIGWDGQENDWHAWLAVREADGIVVLDSIMGLQRPASYRHARIVYSISDQGVWDHAPDYVPAVRAQDWRMVPERAARHAANNRQDHKGVLK
ncbi:MAG: transglutaminase-like cysteine peptidase [Rhodospirillaceae bacterium]|nr:transglutaminase-like cysteine peptidase [Rhodospirillaceae bacterium]